MSVLTTDEKMDLVLEKTKRLEEAIPWSGYVFHRTEDSFSNLAGKARSYILKNQTDKSELRLYFGPKYETFPDGIVVSVARITGERLNIEDYAKRHQCEKFLAADQRLGDSDEFAESINIWFTELAALLNGELRDILLGRKWEEIPFDWDPYK